MLTEAQLKEMLTSRGIFPSYHRLKILKYIIEARNHPTVDEIYRALQREIPTLSKSTVYNNLNVLYEKGILRRLHVGIDETRYDLADRLHAHFKCKVCGRIYDVDIPYDRLEGMVKKALYGTWHRIDSIDLIISGICERCLRESN